MRKSLLIALMLIMIFAVGCSEEDEPIDNTPKPGITAEEFNTRLMAMSETLDIKELAEISTLIINANKEDFDDIEGWDAGIFFPTKRITLGSKSVLVRLSDRGDRITSVEYYYEDDDFEDFLHHNQYSTVGGQRERIDLRRTGQRSLGISWDHAHILVIQALNNEETIRLEYSWGYTNSTGRLSVISCYYSYCPDGTAYSNRLSIHFYR
jgi:hypothetical protein